MAPRSYGGFLKIPAQPSKVLKQKYTCKWLAQVMSTPLISMIWSPGRRRPSWAMRPSGKTSWTTTHRCKAEEAFQTFEKEQRRRHVLLCISGRYGSIDSLLIPAVFCDASSPYSYAKFEGKSSPPPLSWRMLFNFYCILRSITAENYEGCHRHVLQKKKEKPA